MTVLGLGIGDYAAIAAGVAVLVMLGTVATLAYRARHPTIVHDHLLVGDLPTALDDIRIVFISDIHAGPWFGDRQMRRLVETVNKLEADIVVLGGDYVGGKRGGAKVFYPAVSGFEARYAKVAVLGNHDVWEGEQEAREGLVAGGFALLSNSNVRVAVREGEIVLAGVEDMYTGDPSVTAAARGIRREDVAVLISHNPDVFPEQLRETAELWDLALGGHTHGGQVSVSGRAFILPSKYGQKYRTGWIDEHGVPLLVSNGVGTVAIPIRFKTPPEIHLIRLRAPGTA